MPKKNKGSTNGFFLFMMEYRNKNGISMHKASEAAGVIWNQMSADQKQPYNDRAAALRNKEKGMKKTALNEVMVLVEQQEMEEKHAEQRMQTDIKTTIKRYVVGETIHSEYFYIMHVNIFCQATTTERYYPAEIALLRFNFLDGVKQENIYHAMIKPGMLPKGYALKAKSTSEETHKITPPGFDDDECNLYEVFQRIELFLKENESESYIPPIYVCNKDMKLVAGVLNQLCVDYVLEMENNFKVYSLEYLLFSIRNCLTEEIVWPTVSQSFTELERDVYDYTPNISCDYHESCDAPLHCSKSIVTRLAYILCDNCCPVMGIRLKPGHHIPQNKTFVSNTFAAPSYASTRDNYSSRSSSTERYSTAVDDDYGSVLSHRGNSTYGGDSFYSQMSLESVRRKPNTKSLGVVGDDNRSVRSGFSSMPRNDFVLPIGRGRGRKAL